MGSDQSIEEAARQSYGAGTRPVTNTRNLLRYLMRNHHTSPFEMAELVFQVYVPMDIWRQWVRHRTANVNEYSTRYSLAIDDNYKTETWRKQPKQKQQGSREILLDPENWLTAIETGVHENSVGSYKDLITLGVAREQARKVLTLDTFTLATWKIDLHNLFNFLKLRLDNHAQQEIRQYAKTIADITKTLYPLSFSAFEDYVLNAVQLSDKEILILGELISSVNIDKIDSLNSNIDLTNREIVDLKTKLNLIQNRYINEKIARS